MRLWSLHPQYLDRQGLLAVWREGLLAQAVLRGHTKGYRNHPQLDRFKTHTDPRMVIAFYLDEIYREAIGRGYRFNRDKFTLIGNPENITVTTGQMQFERRHLLVKLKKRSPRDYARVANLEDMKPHPLFRIVPGAIAPWEKT